MFQPFGDWPPPPRHDPPRRPAMSDKDERRLVTAVCLFLLALFLAPIAGGSLFDAVRVAISG